MKNRTIIIDETKLNDIVRTVINKITNPFVKQKDGLYHFTSQEDIAKYGDAIWDILTNSYRKIGGFMTYSNKEAMVNRTSLLTAYIKNGRPIVCAIYRNNPSEENSTGKKMVGCGTLHGTVAEKEYLKKIIKDDIDNYQKWHWCEVSGAIEKWFKDLNGNPIPSSFVSSILKMSRKNIKETGDGVHYSRFIGGSWYTKYLYGFKDEQTYNKVIDAFEDYNDFKAFVNSDGRINEYFNYRANHEDETIAKAMEIIGQTDNMYEDGFRELTPLMTKYLQWAISTLKGYKNGQMSRLIKQGLLDLQEMPVLECHTMTVESDPMFAPAF